MSKLPYTTGETPSPQEPGSFDLKAFLADIWRWGIGALVMAVVAWTTLQRDVEDNADAIAELKIKAESHHESDHLQRTHLVSAQELAQAKRETLQKSVDNVEQKLDRVLLKLDNIDD